MKHTISTLTFLLFYLTASAQYQFGIKANFGFSKINSRNDIEINQKYFFNPSVQGGLYFNYPISNKSSLGTELFFTQIEGKETANSEINEPDGSPTGRYISVTRYKHISYIGLPIYYVYKIKKLTFNVGLQANILLSNSAEDTYQGDAYGNGRIYTDKVQYELFIDKYDFGARCGIVYDLNKKFAVEGNYYQGINNILKKVPSLYWKWNIQQMTIGLRYKLFAK